MSHDIRRLAPRLACFRFTFPLLALAGVACDSGMPGSVSEAGLDAYQREGRVTVCHAPEGDVAKAFDLLIDASSVPDHLGHGDLLGPCLSIHLGGPLPASGFNQQAIWGIDAATAWINLRGGIFADGARRSLRLVHEDIAIADACADDDIEFLVAPYGTSATGLAVEAALDANCGKAILVWGAAGEDNFEMGYPYLVQSLTPGGKYHAGILHLVHDAVNDPDVPILLALAYEQDGFAASVAAGASSLAGDLGFEIVFPPSASDCQDVYPKGGDYQQVDAYVACNLEPLSLAGTIIGGGHQNDSDALAQVLFDRGLAPDAVSLLVAPAGSGFCTVPDGTDPSDHYSDKVSGPAQWDPDVSFPATYGPQQAEFLALFDEVSGDAKVEYQAVAAAASALTLAQAIEQVATTDTTAVWTELEGLTTTTLFGDFDIDETGLQVGHTMVDIQCQNGKREVVYPYSVKTADFLYGD